MKFIEQLLADAKKLELRAEENTTDYLKRVNCGECDGEGEVDEYEKIEGDNIIPGGMYYPTDRKSKCKSCQNNE